VEDMKTDEVGEKKKIPYLHSSKKMYEFVQDDKMKRIRWTGNAERMARKVNS
jgi:hypothetical protein